MRIRAVSPFTVGPFAVGPFAVGMATVRVVRNHRKLLCIVRRPQPVSYTHLTLPTICSV